jgi:CheY-like chemotaxis protein
MSLRESLSPSVAHRRRVIPSVVQPIQAQAITPKGAEVRATAASPLVLVTDDDEDVRTLCQLQLELAGFRVSQAANGQEALDRARSDRPDLILLDVMMPVMDGWECLAELKRDGKLRDIPVFVVTGKDQQQDQERAFALGAEAFISKPFQGQVLIARIRERLAAA